MNQTPLKTIRINSSDVVNHFDSMIVHLAKVIAVEQQCSNEDAVQSVRKILQGKANELRVTQTAIPDIIKVYRKKVASGTATTLEKVMYDELTKSGEIES